MRLLWYIASCYDEMLAKQQKKIDLRNLADQKNKQVPMITKYKGQKVMEQDQTQTKKVYGFNRPTQLDKSPLAKTPTKTTTPAKSAKNVNNNTPVKQKLTEKKKDAVNLSTSSKKWPTTAKK